MKKIKYYSQCIQCGTWWIVEGTYLDMYFTSSYLLRCNMCDGKHNGYDEYFI